MSRKPNPGRARKKSTRATSSTSSAPAGLLTPDGRFWFDEDAAQRACGFFPDILRHVKGKWAGQEFELQEWAYRDIIRPLFGWKRFDGTGPDKKINATRRYRTIFVFIPKKNGKTSIAAGLALYMLHCDGEQGGEVYSAAGDRFQAAIAHDIAKQMTLASPPLNKRSIVYKNSIVAPQTNSFYKALSSDAPCLHPDTILELSDGSRIAARDVMEGDHIAAWNGTGLVTGIVAEASRQPSTPLYRIATHRGREIIVTGEHPLWIMKNGRRHKDLTHKYHWVKACDVALGDRVAVALGWPMKKEKSSQEDIEQAWALGAWAGDGECGRFRFINVDGQIVTRLRQFIVKMGGFLISHISTRQKQKGDHNGFPHEHHLVGVGKRRKSPGREWIRKHFGQAARSHTKDVPAWIWGKGRDVWAAFLAGYLDTDGCVPSRLDGASWSSESPDMLRSCQALLARLGINASIARNKLTVSGWSQLCKLQRIIGPFMALDKKSNLLKAAANKGRKRGFDAHQADRITLVEELPPGESISIEVDKFDTHVTNGLITHNTKHGLNPSAIIFDELHTQPNRDLWETLSLGVAARRQPVTFIITTAGDDLDSLCGEMYQHALDVIEDPSIDESFLAVVHQADAEEDARDPEYWARESTWAKANPGLGVTISADYMRQKINTARLIVSEQNAIKRLHLNLWSEQETRWIDMGLWDANAGKVDPAALVGRECVGGLDLSSVSDITALVLLFQDPPTDEGGPIYTWLPFFWLPEVRLKKQELKEDGKKKRASRDALNTELYRRWHKAGLIRVTPGNAIDYAYIRRDIADEIGKKYEIKEIAIDPWNALQIATELGGDGFLVTALRQGFGSMSSPTKDVERVLLGHRLRHGGNPVLRWMARNMSVEINPSGDKKPSKEKARNKIDGIVAGIMATGIAPKVLGLEPFTGAIRTIEVG